MLRLLLVLVLLLPLRAGAQGYLSDPSLIGPAWGELMAELPPEPALALLVIGEDSIEVQARAREGGPRVDAWRVVRKKGMMGIGKGDVVAGPSPVQPMGPVDDVTGAFFQADDVPVGRLPQMMAQALEAVALSDPGQVTGLRLERIVTILPEPAYGEPRWSIALSNGRESASVSLTLDGRPLGADISQTDRGRARDFLTQSDWPFALAQEGFGTLVGGGPTVRKVVVRKDAISVTAASPDFAGQLTDWTWDGGSFKRGLIDTPDLSAQMSNPDLPFALGEIDLSRLPQVLAAARAAVDDPGVAVEVRSVEATKPPAVAEVPVAQWRVTLSGPRPLIGGDPEDDWEIRVSSSAEVIEVLPPARLRAALSYVDGAAFADAVAAYVAQIGGESAVLEVMARPDRMEVTGFDARDMSMTLTISYDQKGFDMRMPFPVMMQTQADLFYLKALSALTPGSVEAMKAKAMAEVAIEGSEVYSLRVWSGAPFWRDPQGGQFVDVRVGVPPRYDVSGYVVFKLDGTHVETVR